MPCVAIASPNLDGPAARAPCASTVPDALLWPSEPPAEDPPAMLQGIPECLLRVRGEPHSFVAGERRRCVADDVFRALFGQVSPGCEDGRL